jgi:PmbA protein
MDGAAAALRGAAERALALMRAHGFEHAQATVSVTSTEEINVAHNEPSLLRSTELARLALTGIVDRRRASTELTAFDDTEALDAQVAALRADADAAPADDANAVSAGQRAVIRQGPQRADLDAVRGAVRDLLAFRERQTPRVVIDECFFAHNRRQSHTLTTGGSDLACSVGWYSASVFAVARDGKAVSSFNGVDGTADALDGDIGERFGIADMLRDTERQTRTRPIGPAFTGDVVLAPNAAGDLVEWLLGQLGDAQLIAGTSLYRSKVGSAVCSPLLTLKSRFSAPGVAAVSADAFVTPDIDVVRSGELRCLLPTLYGSRKTGLPHVPTAAAGWELSAGTLTKQQLIEGVQCGALVGRLSMGRPASNGDFSGIIKNSFAIADGRLGDALSETMISGNIARMLRDVSGISRERIDAGGTLLPYLRVPGLHFS